MLYSEVPIPKPPYFKGKGFMAKLCPIIEKGIIREADSRLNPKVIGTVAWENFWCEEIYKIINGVYCPGVGWIPGRFYYYMNYKVMSTILGVITPDMCDLYLELAYFIDYCKKNGINILDPKARRRGISEAATTMVVDYDFRFIPGSQSGVAAGKKIYVEDFLTKWRYSDSSLPPELSIKKLTDNDDEIIAGFNIKNEFGAFEEKGSKSTIYARTMHTNPNMFKGLFLNNVISEEIGEHERWFEFYTATKDCLMSNNKQVGMMMAFGTGGNVNKGSKDFKRISEEAEAYNFIEYVIDARRAYYYGGAKEKHRGLPLETEWYKTHKAHELIGVEDLFLAEKNILLRREKLLKAGNLKEYNEELQNNPLNKKEIFRKTVVNNFNIDKLNNQQHEIDSLEFKKYSRYILEWEKDADGLIKTPWKVIATPAQPTDSDINCVYIIDSEHPRLRTHKNLYVAGIDSYNIDTSKTSKSLGAMCVLIRENNINHALRKVPVAIIRTRPPRKEKFYEMCLQMAVYYNIVGNVLGDIRSDGILEYWKTRGGERYLAGRPAKFESANSEVGTDYWFSINKNTKPLMVGVMQKNIEDHVQDIWFPQLIDEQQNYDEVEIGSDNDLCDAWGIALVQDICADIKPKDITLNENDDTWELPEWGTDSNGNVIMKSERPHLDDIEQDHNSFGELFG